MIVLPQRIYIRRDKIGELDQEKSISLNEILNDKRLKAGVSYGRYPKKLNAIIGNHLNKKRFLRFSPQPVALPHLSKRKAFTNGV